MIEFKLGEDFLQDGDLISVNLEGGDLPTVVRVKEDIKISTPVSAVLLLRQLKGAVTDDRA